MEAKENLSLNFDLNDLPKTIKAKQGDFGARKICFTLVHGNEEVIPAEDSYILINLRRPDGGKRTYKSGVENSPIKINGAEVTFEITKWCTETPGSVFMEIALMSGVSKITTETAIIKVTRAVRTDEDFADDENADILVELITLTKNLAQDIDRAAKNAQDIADTVRASYENGEFKLRYEDMTKEQKEEMFSSLPAIDPDDLDLYQDPETYYVYPVYKGIRSANGIPLAASGGSGAAANNAVMTVTNITGWQYKSIAQNADCYLSLKWSSLENGAETGDGSVIVRVDGSLKYSANCRQGEITLNVAQYLSGGSNTVKITVSDVYGNSKTVTFTINIVVLTVTSGFDSSVAYSGDISYYYIPTGQAEKTVHFILDNAEIGTQTVTESGRQQTYIIPAQSHGSHTLLVYFTALIDGELVASNGLFYDLICREEGNDTDVIASDFQSTAGEQYIALSLPFIVYSPTALTADVDIYVNDELYQQLRGVDRTKQTFTYVPNDFGELLISIRTATARKDFALSIAETSISVSAVTNNLALYLTAQGRSNAEQEPSLWCDEKNNIYAEMSGFNFVSDGWQTDSDGNTCLRITGGAKITVPYKIFEKDFRTEGKTIEFEFSTKEILNYDTTIIDCMSDGRGFIVTPQYAKLISEQSEIDTQYKEDEHIRLAFVIEKRANNRLILMYLDGVMCGAAQYPVNDNFQQVSPVDIVIGSRECTVDLYNIRIYDNDLTRFQILDNWIADTQNGTLKKERFERNDIFDAYGAMVVSKLPRNLPYLTVTTPVLPQYKGDKKTVEVEYEDPQDANNSFTAQGVQWDVQGTSSQYYYKKNFKGKYKKGFLINGTQSATYQLRDDSVPTSVFTYKADVASSEGANNVELVRLYNDAMPFKTPPQRDDSRVRVGIDGIPIVMFHNDGNGAKFYGKMNFNNDKSTGEVFGFKEGDEYWSIENNTSLRCLFRSAEGTDEEYLADFACEYPEDNKDVTNLRKLCEWVSSTCREGATGEELSEPVAYGDKTFTHDTEDYRLEKFRNELSQHFYIDSATFYYLFTEIFLMIDSRAKNCMLTYFKDENLWYLFPYDMDTALGINNEGKLVYSYNLEDTDTMGGDDVFNGQKSTLWVNLREAFPEKFPPMYQAMRSGLITYAEVERRFEEHQSKWSEAIFNEDSFVKCLEPLIRSKDSTYLPMLQGSKAGQRKWWLFNRFKYMDSKYAKGDVLSDYINIRAYGTADFDITPYADIYVSVSFDGKLVQKRSKRGEVTHIENPLDDANDAVIAVYSASQLKDIGDLSGIKPKLIDVSSAVKLQKLKIGDAAEDYTNEQLTELTIGNNNLIKSIDVRNCVNLGKDVQKSVDVSGCKNIEELYFENTAINGVELPNGGILKTLHLPNTISNLSILNQTALTDFSLESSENITSLRVENSPVETKTIVAGMAAGSRIRLLNVDWSFEDFNEIEGMMNRLDTMTGLDEYGYNLPDVQITGTWRIRSLNSAQLREIQERYSWINIIYDELILNVTFINFDGTELLMTTVSRTMTSGASLDPIASELIETPTRADEERDGIRYHYSFEGWDNDTGDISDDTVFTAQYAEKRYFTVTFVNYDNSLLASVMVVDGERCVYPLDEEPTKPAQAPYIWAFSGWDYDLSTPITQDMTLTAQYVSREPIVSYYNGDTLIRRVSVPYMGCDEFDRKDSGSYNMAAFLDESGNPIRPVGVDAEAVCAGFWNSELKVMEANEVTNDISLYTEWLVPKLTSSDMSVWYSDDGEEIIYFPYKWGYVGKFPENMKPNVLGFNETIKTLRLQHGTDFWYAFDKTGCTLETLILPSTFSTQTANAFGSASLKAIYVSSFEKWISKNYKLDDYTKYSDSANYFIGITNSTRLYVNGVVPSGEYRIPDGVEYVSANSFKPTDITKVIISEGVRYIGSRAFEGMGTLNDVIFEGEGYLKFSDKVFKDCYNLQTVDLREGTININNYSFMSSGLIRAKLPGTITQIGVYAFYQISNELELDLRSFELNDDNSVKCTAGSGSYVFSANTKIVFRNIDIATAYSQATNWSNYAAKMYYYDDDNNLVKLTEG